MTYSSGNTILATDYNTFVGTVNTVIGPSASYQSGTGYGQSTLATVASTDTIGASEWASLITAVKNAATHQGTTINLPGTNPSTGDLIEALDGTTSGATSYNLSTAVSSISANKDNVNAAQQSTIAGSTTNTRSTTWGQGSVSIDCEYYVQFSSRTHAEAFFNTGGEVHVTFQHPNGTTSQDVDWRDIFANKIGTLKLGKTTTTRTGSSGSTPAFGYTGLTSSYQNIFTGTNIGGGVYGANDVTVQAKLDTTNHRVYFYVVLSDQHTAISPSTADNVAAGTAVSTGFRKSTVYNPGTPSVTVTNAF
jgi:hypothetical protein